MASNRGASATHSHMTLAAVSTPSNIPLFPLTAMMRDSLIHQSWNSRRFQWNKHGRMKIGLGYVQSISLQLWLTSIEQARAAMCAAKKSVWTPLA